MPDRWIGVVVSGDRVVVVDAEVPAIGPLVVQGDATWPLQTGGDRAAAYAVIHRQMVDYVTDNNIVRVVIKASAVGQGALGLAHLRAAEVRGVVMAAAAAVETHMLSKAQISRTFGDRKVDQYVADGAFWSSSVVGVNLRMGSREAAMLLLASRNAS